MASVKRLTNNFSGISIASIEKLYHIDDEKKNYLENKLNREGKIVSLYKYIKI